MALQYDSQAKPGITTTKHLHNPKKIQISNPPNFTSGGGHLNGYKIQQTCDNPNPCQSKRNISFRLSESLPKVDQITDNPPQTPKNNFFFDNPNDLMGLNGLNN